MRTSKWDHNLKWLCLWEEEETPELCFSTPTLRKGHGSTQCDDGHLQAKKSPHWTPDPAWRWPRAVQLSYLRTRMSMVFCYGSLSKSRQGFNYSKWWMSTACFKPEFQKVGATHWHKCCLLDVVMGWIVTPPNLYIDILTPSTVECDFTWK